MSTNRALSADKASAVLTAARAALRELPERGATVAAAAAARAVDGTTPGPARAPVPRPESPPGAGLTSRPVATPAPTPAGGATGRNTAQQNPTFRKTNPRRPAGLRPRQTTAARLLRPGRGKAEVAPELGAHPSAAAPWKHDPLLSAELRRPLDRATKTNTAQQKPTPAIPPAQNEPISR